MMLRRLLLMIVVSCIPLVAQVPDLISGPSDSSSVAATTPDTVRTLRILDRTVENQAFSAGEKLTFAIRYGFIRAGTAVMEVKEKVMVKDSIPAYRILTTARSSRGFDPFYRVRDSVETIIDARGFFSWRFEKRLREGGYKYDLLVDYIQERGYANVETIRYHSDEPLRVKHRAAFELDIPAYVLDVLSSFYYIRTQPLEMGMPIYMTNHDNKKIYDLKVIVQKRERVKVDAGEFDCVVVIPLLQGDAIFKQEGKMSIWLTDDKLRIPVLMKSKVAVGSISSELQSIEGVGHIPAKR